MLDAAETVWLVVNGVLCRISFAPQTCPAGVPNIGCRENRSGRGREAAVSAPSGKTRAVEMTALPAPLNATTFTLVIAASLRGTEFAKWSGKSMYLPKSDSDRPSIDELRMHRANAGL
jgi:hypothetical protein